MTRKQANLHIRVSDETKALLEQLAAADGRSVTNYIEQLVKRAAEKEAGRK